MFYSYFDESWDQFQKKVLVFGGMVGRYEQWARIEWPWRSLLEKYGIRYYRASDAEFARGEFAKEPFRTGNQPSTPKQYRLLQSVREEFFEVITRGTVTGFAIQIPVEVFWQVADTPEKKEAFGGTPYYICAHTSLLRLLKEIKYEVPSKELIKFVCDRQHDFEKEMKKVHAHMQTKECEFHSQVGSISFEDKTGFIPLQVADTFVYETRKDVERKMADPNASERPEFARMKAQGKIAAISECGKTCLEFYLADALRRTKSAEPILES